MAALRNTAWWLSISTQHESQPEPMGFFLSTNGERSWSTRCQTMIRHQTRLSLTQNLRHTRQNLVIYCAVRQMLPAGLDTTNRGSIPDKAWLEQRVFHQVICRFTAKNGERLACPDIILEGCFCFDRNNYAYIICGGTEWAGYESDEPGLLTLSILKAFCF